MAEPIRVMLVGCGKWSATAHLPVIAKMNGRAELTHIIEISGRETAVRNTLKQQGINNWNQVTILETNHGILPSMPDNIDACIVATISEQHLPYLKWSLENGIHTLSDKPLTSHRDASTQPDQARLIATDYRDLIATHQSKEDVIFMLATQKRYQWAFHKIAERIEKVAKTGYPITAVDCSTSDGYWLLPWEYSGHEYHSYDFGGGKLTHTGYHFLDIVPWLMRHSDLSGNNSITHAFVTANLFRPSDSVALMDGHDVRRLLRSDGTLEGEIPNDLGDINSYLQVKFCNGRRLVTSVNFTFMHEGFSLRTSDATSESTGGRNKIDHIMLFQGPLFYTRFSRIAKMLDADAISPIGRPDHFELDFISNNLTNLPRIERLMAPSTETYEGCGDDELPTTDFLEAVINPSKRSRIITPVSDHKIGISLLSAAYESAALSYAEPDGRPVPVKIEFDEKDWVKPPRFWR